MGLRSVSSIFCSFFAHPATTLALSILDELAKVMLVLEISILPIYGFIPSLFFCLALRFLLID